MNNNAMYIPDMKLSESWFNRENLELKATRDGYGDALVEVGKENQDIVALAADLTESTRTHLFAEAFPKRFFQTGIAEQNMMGIAAGLALNGKIPFAASYAVFSPGRNWDQLRVSVCYSQANVKFISSHSGLSVGPDGATHQSLEDIAITRVLPNLTVLSPADYFEAKKSIHAAAKHVGPVYIRLSREKTPVFTTEETPFEIGKAQVLYSGTDITLISTGILTYEAMLAAHELAQNNISVDVINIHTIKPIDKDTIIQSAKKTGAVVTIEEHQIHGGLGSAVAEVLSEAYPVKIKMMGMNDEFGQSGNGRELLERYGLTSSTIVSTVKNMLSI